jgi:CheY-like chemotaxis protein/predicted DNA-binding protein (UPF0251 family)
MAARPSGNYLPTSYLNQIKDALKHLYDFPYLQKHPLVKTSGRGDSQSVELGARKLRQEVLAAIELLNPQSESTVQTPQTRIHSLLVLHYVEGWSVQEAAHELGISSRQAHRNLRDGEQSVAAILWTQQPVDEEPEPRAVYLSSIQAEISRIVPKTQPVDLLPLLHRAYLAVERQAVQRDIDLQIDIPSRPVIVATDVTIAQQVFINLLSHSIRQSVAGAVQVVVKISNDRVKVSVAYVDQPQWFGEPAMDSVLSQLVGHLGWSVQDVKQKDGTRLITMDVASHRPVILVIDDNEGLVRLLDSYLTDHACQVKATDNGQDGLDLALELKPDAIILDVMLPGMDGWEVLQRLRNRPQTAAIPVIMCSVLKSPELAYSLGASLYLSKPISRDDILKALHEIKVV